MHVTALWGRSSTVSIFLAGCQQQRGKQSGAVNIVSSASGELKYLATTLGPNEVEWQLIASAASVKWLLYKISRRQMIPIWSRLPPSWSCPAYAYRTSQVGSHEWRSWLLVFKMEWANKGHWDQGNPGVLNERARWDSLSRQDWRCRLPKCE